MKNFCILVCALFALTLTSCDTESTDYNSQNVLDEFNVKASRQPVTNLSGTKVYVSSNTSGTIGVYDVVNGSSMPNASVLTVPYADADGIIYDANRDALYQVNRSDNRLVVFPEISSMMDGAMIIPSAMGPSNFSQGREASFYNNKAVVVDDIMPGQLLSYHVNDDNINEFRSHQVNFKLWGIQVTGKDLWAIQDADNKLSYFKDFFKAKSGMLMPTITVNIEGLVRTHGLNYDANSDIMVLTDIGSAGSAEDGALVVITDFINKFNAAGDGGTIALSDQVRIEGPSTELGNPVDVVVNAEKNAIYVAERAQGKFLIFDIPTENCECAPVYSTEFAGASAVTTDF